MYVYTYTHMRTHRHTYICIQRERVVCVCAFCSWWGGDNIVIVCVVCMCFHAMCLYTHTERPTEDVKCLTLLCSTLLLRGSLFLTLDLG